MSLEQKGMPLEQKGMTLEQKDRQPDTNLSRRGSTGGQDVVYLRTGEAVKATLVAVFVLVPAPAVATVNAPCRLLSLARAA